MSYKRQYTPWIGFGGESTKYEKYNSDCLEGFNIATDEFEQNLLKALEEVIK